MKRFLRRRWHGLPIGIIASVLIGTAVLAATAYFTVTQIITQDITEPYVPPEEDYGIILAPDIDLSKVATNSSFSQTLTGAVIVELGPDGAGEALKLVCVPDPLYTSFGVTITLTSKPEGSGVMLAGYGITGAAEVSIDLDLEGTYIFDQTIEGVAGSETGSASSTITLTLEESTTPAR